MYIESEENNQNLQDLPLEEKNEVEKQTLFNLEMEYQQENQENSLQNTNNIQLDIESLKKQHNEDI